jgi:hypothetical protein
VPALQVAVEDLDAAAVVEAVGSGRGREVAFGEKVAMAVAEEEKAASGGGGGRHRDSGAPAMEEMVPRLLGAFWASLLGFSRAQSLNWATLFVFYFFFVLVSKALFSYKNF